MTATTRTASRAPVGSSHVPAGSRRAAWAAGAIAAVAWLLAWSQRFVQDDAFISFFYARNLVEGQGLTWFGDRVEGYTNFLWVLWIALGLRLGADPVVWAWVGGLAAFAAALHAVWQLGRFLFAHTAYALVALALFASHYSVLAFATGGLETMLQTALLAQAALQVARLASDSKGGGSLARPIVLSLLLAAAVLTRPDSVLAAGVLGVTAFRRLGATRGATAATGATASVRPARRAQLALVAPAAVVLGAWLAWKLAYYGALLPNTFHAKVRWDAAILSAGALYLRRYLGWYGLGLVWIVVGLERLARRLRRRVATRGVTQIRGGAPPADGASAARRNLWTALTVWVCAWLVYAVLIGGDFMEFRLLVPVTPPLFLLTVALVRAAVPRVEVAAAFAVVLAGFSFHHARTFRDLTPDRRLDSVAALSTFYERYPDGDFSPIGRALGEQLHDTGATLALHAVGAIPYYSRLRTLDMFGLTDRRIARTGLPAPPAYRRPGHQRLVSVAEMRARGIHLVIGNPTLLEPGVLVNPQAARALAGLVGAMIAFDPAPVGQVQLVGIPLPNDKRLLAWYLTPSPAIDAVVTARGWERSELRMR